MAKIKEQSFCEFDFTGCYGSKEPQSKIKEFILNTWKDNCLMEENNLPKFVVNIWGAAGYAKTACVKSFKDIEVDYKGSKKKFQIVDIPLGQTEEMGDILGVPESFIEIKKGDEIKKVVAENAVLDYYFKRGWDLVEGARTEMSYAPPAWVPTEEGPGIIIFDDANRASVRILKGIMQLIQDYRTIGWSIPDGWMIVCTGNPDNNNYIVASQDDAMITRMKHITMNPSVEQWCEWARSVNIDDRGISFLLKNPEMIYPKKDADGNVNSRTNFRTITNFFMSLPRFEKITDKNKRDFFIEGLSCVDEDFVNQFYLFLTRDYSLTLDPLDILERPEKAKKEIHDWMNGSEVRIDMLNITIERLMHFLTKKEYKTSNIHKENIVKFLLNDEIPASMVHSTMRRINDCENIKSYIRGNDKLKELVIEMLRMNNSSL